MMAFIWATDFDFIAYMSKMAFFGKLFSRQGRFWNMIVFAVRVSVGLKSLIFAYLHLKNKCQTILK